jgi:hypothetical protein
MKIVMSHFTMGFKQGLAKLKQSGQVVKLPGAAQADCSVRVEAAKRIFSSKKFNSGD